MARLHSTPDDFALVGMDDDPTPGDPDLIRAVLTRYRDIGDAAEKALNVLKKDGTISAGRGSAMDKLKEKVGDDLPDKLTKTMTSYHDAAQAYSDYIPRLQEAQDTFDRAVEQARTAAPKANQQPTALGDDPTDQQKSAAARVQDDIDAGQSELGAAKSLAQQAKSMRESAQATAADVLDRAAGEAIPERNIFQKIADFFKDFPFVQILLGLLIAVVSVFFPVAGLLLGGALFAITQLPAILSGNFDLGDLLVGLVGLIPGGALLKAGGGLAKAGLGALAPAAFKAASGSIKGIKSTVDASKTVGPLVNTGGKVIGEAAGEFADEAAQAAVDQAVHGEGFDPAAIAAAGAAGLLGVGGIAKGKGKGGGDASGGPPGSTDRGLFGKGKGKDTGGGGGDKKKPGFSFGSVFGKGVRVQPGGVSGLRYQLFFDERSPDGEQPPRLPDDPNIPPNHLPSAQAVPGPANVTSGVGTPPVGRTTDEPLFRVDDRDPDEIFRTGFLPRPAPGGGHGNIQAHNAVSNHAGNSGFVSATRRDDYEIQEGTHKFHLTAAGGFDTNASVPEVHPPVQGQPSVFRFEQEILFPGGIRTQNVAGVERADADGNLGPFEHNPNFNPNAVNQQFPNHVPFNPAPAPQAPPQPAPPAQPTASSSTAAPPQAQPSGSSQQQPLTSAFQEDFADSDTESV